MNGYISQYLNIASRQRSRSVYYGQLFSAEVLAGHSRESTIMAAITEEQIQLVKETWSIPKQNPIDSGEVIFIRFLEKYPHNKEKFAAFRNIPLLSLKVSHRSVSFIFRKYKPPGHSRATREFEPMLLA